MPQQQPAPESQKNLNEFNKFLENNVDFLEEKYAEHFKQPFPFNELQTKARIELAIEFIYDVFSFQKYKNDQKMNATLRKSLRDNIVNFVKEQEAKSKKTGAEDKKAFTPQQGIKLLKYCIQNNEMFAVHYDKKEKKAQIQKQPEITNQNNSQHQEKSLKDQDWAQESPIEKQAQVKNNSRLSEKSSPLKETQKSESPHVNEFPTTSQQQKQHIQTLKKQAKIIFEFYCKQQLNTGGPNATFDKISHESNTMTLGKFMAFANTTTILYQTKVQAYKPKDQKMLDKKTINQIFRKISKGQKEIDFEQFFELIVKLNQIDPSVYEKLNMNKSQTHNKILRKLKYLNTPFNMKMHLAKQPQTFIIEEKPYIPINTAHSGKFQSSIKEDIEERKQKLRLLPHQPYPNPNQIKLSYETFMGNESSLRQKFLQQQVLQSRIRSGNNKFLSERILAPGSSKTTTDQSSKKPQMSKIRLQNSRVSFGNDMKEEINALQGLIMPDDDNDELFLKQYKIPKLSSNIGLRRKSNNSQLNQSIDQGIVSQSRKFSGFKTQRKNVVNDIKQRILQVEKTERKQMTGRNTQRPYKYESHSSASRNARY